MAEPSRAEKSKSSDSTEKQGTANVIKQDKSTVGKLCNIYDRETFTITVCMVQIVGERDNHCQALARKSY